MRRPFLLLLLLLLAATTLVYGQNTGESRAVDPTYLPPEMLGAEGSRMLPYVIEEVEWEELPLNIRTQAGTDQCSDAPLLDLPAGDILLTNFMTTDPSDPDLSQCMYGSPLSPQGYRSVWYSFFPLQSGVVNIQTSFDPASFFNSYDTVVALYRSTDINGGCDFLDLVACNDDAWGFQSEIDVFVQQWETYYIEVVDWNFGIQGEALLRLSVTFEPGESNWEVQQAASNSWPKPYRTRHMVTYVNAGPNNDFLYVIAGQTDDPNSTPSRDGQVDRYHVQSGTWEIMQAMPSASDPFGYSNTTAAQVNGRVYVPAGFVGNTSSYEGTHRVYDIGNDHWYVNQNPVPWNLLYGQPYAWSQAVVPTQAGDGYYLTGGVLPQNNDLLFQPVPNLLFFTPSSDGQTGFWNITLPNMSVPRYAHVAAAVTRQTPNGPEEQICVASGITKDGDIYRSIAHAECYSPLTGTWNAIAPMNFNRHMAGSAVGPDGRWYVFGGTSVATVGDQDILVPITFTEVYDPATDAWQVLDSRFDLREPFRRWPRGAFVGDTLWVFGGETFNAETETWDAVPLVTTLQIPMAEQMLPVLQTSRLAGQEPNDTIQTAIPIPLNQPVFHNFELVDDYFDFFSFVVPFSTHISARLTDIPHPSNYDIYLYNSDKFLVGWSTNIGSLPENAETYVLNPGVYYAMVVRVTAEPSTSNYRLEIVPE